MTPATRAKRERAALERAIARDLKSRDRGKLAALRERLRVARVARRREFQAARAACRARRALPTVRALAAALRRDKAYARKACAVDWEAARALKDVEARRRAELVAEKKEQRALRRIERLHAQKKPRPGVARASRGESDDEVRGNIPPELVALFERVKRSIRGDARKSRTEAFLEYAEAHPDEEWDALEGAVDREIREMERRQAMANPKTKKKARKGKAKRGKATKRRKAGPFARGIVVAPKKKRRPPPKKKARTGARPMAAPTKRKKKRATKAKPNLRAAVTFVLLHAGKRRVGATASAGPRYFRSPPEARAANILRLWRGTPREKKAAVAIARLEAEHDGPPRKANGGSAGLSDEDARREYVDKHWGDKGRGGIRTARAADPAHGTLVKMGKVIAITYATKKRGDGFAHYEHEFEGPFPDLLFSDGGLVIAGGGYTVKRGGITG